MSFLEEAKSGIAAIRSGRDYIDTLANKYIVKPLGAEGIGGFLFDYEGETTLALQADITDHYVEDNTAINDHVAIKPTKVTVRGFIGELVKNKPTGILGAIQKLITGLSIVPAYIGDYTPGVLQEMQNALQGAQNSINTADQALSRAENIVGLFGGNNTINQTRQQKAYQQLESMFLTKQIFTVETPYKFFDSMVIESLSFIQDETTKYMSDITITLKQVRFANIKFSTLDNAQFAGAAAYQKQDLVDQGKQKGGPAELTSIAFEVFH